MTRRKLDIKQAAQVLNITTDAVHKRVKRGTLEAEKDGDGRVYVWLDDIWPPDHRDELIDRLENEVEYLRREAQDWKEESRRKDAILLTMAQRIPELEPTSPETPPEAAQSNGTREEGASLRPDTHEPQNSTEQRSWWQRLFGG